ncbi:hypothetical protein RSAG8_13603, partial [Rhizoctonia solani AG-8 WAC10335]
MSSFIFINSHSEKIPDGRVAGRSTKTQPNLPIDNPESEEDMAPVASTSQHTSLITPPAPVQRLTRLRPWSEPPPNLSETRRMEIAFLLARASTSCDCTICTRIKPPAIGPNTLHHIHEKIIPKPQIPDLENLTPKMSNPFPHYNCPHLTRQQQLTMVCSSCAKQAPHCPKGHLLPKGDLADHCHLCAAMTYDDTPNTMGPPAVPKRGRPRKNFKAPPAKKPKQSSK